MNHIRLGEPATVVVVRPGSPFAHDPFVFDTLHEAAAKVRKRPPGHRGVILIDPWLAEGSIRTCSRVNPGPGVELYGVLRRPDSTIEKIAAKVGVEWLQSIDDVPRIMFMPGAKITEMPSVICDFQIVALGRGSVVRARKNATSTVSLAGRAELSSRRK